MLPEYQFPLTYSKLIIYQSMCDSVPCAFITKPQDTSKCWAESRSSAGGCIKRDSWSLSLLIYPLLSSSPKSSPCGYMCESAFLAFRPKYVHDFSMLPVASRRREKTVHIKYVVLFPLSTRRIYDRRRLCPKNFFFFSQLPHPQISKTADCWANVGGNGFPVSTTRPKKSAIKRHERHDMSAFVGRPKEYFTSSHVFCLSGEQYE